MKAVIFDMDGLLIDSEPHWHEAQRRVFPTVGIELSLKDCQDTTGVRIDDVVRLRYAQSPWEGPSLKAIETAIVDELIALMQEKLVAKPGVQEILSFFERKKMPIALASSSSFRIIDAALGKLNLQDAFPVMHSADIEKYAKPHPVVYIHTAEKMGIAPADCLAFEDSLPGVIAAKAAQMTVVVVPEVARPQFAVADMKLESLLDFDEEKWQLLCQK